MLIFIVPIFFLGCANGSFDTKSLMHPPKATGEKAEVQKLLYKEAGQNITLKYPKSGEYRFPVIITNLLNDDREQALAFYSENDDKKSGTNIMIMEKSSDKWRVVTVLKNQGNDIDKICFGDINKDGKKEIIVGWTSFKNTGNIINAYSYDGIDMHTINLIDKYNDFIVADLDDEIGDEILLLTLNSADSPALARLIKFNDQSESINTIGSVDMNADAISYQAIKLGKIDESTLGIFVDEILNGNKTSTEFIYWDCQQKQLKNPLYHKHGFGDSPFIRSDSALSMDIDNDGIIEIPTQYNIKNYTPDINSPLCASTWVKYNPSDNSSKEILNTIINTKDKYIFNFPKEWEEKVTITLDDDILKFNKLVMGENNLDSDNNVLFSIKALPTANLDKTLSENNGYITLKSNDQQSYIALISQDNTLSINENDVINKFKTYN